jgi:hypothetical protein
MSTALTSALSGLETSLKSSIPSDAELRQLEALLVQAHQVKLRASIAFAQQEALAKVAAVHQSAQVQIKALAHEAQEAASQQISAIISTQIAAAQSIEITPSTAPSSEPDVSKAPDYQATEATVQSEEPATNHLSQTGSSQPNDHVEAISSAESTSQTSNEPVAKQSVQPQATLASAATKSVNARYANLNAGLNDRLAFVKSLFGGDDHDYQRVVAYLATLESKAECETFIREAVQPEYDWSKSPDVAERFMNLVYARFE